MTTPVALVGLTYDGDDLQDSDLQLFLQITAGLSEGPSVRGDDPVIPALAGRFESNRVNDVLAVTLEGWVRADPAAVGFDAAVASYRATCDRVRELFAPNRLRADLVATREDGSTATISARPLNTVWNEHVRGFYADVSVSLEAYDDWVVAAAS